MYRSSRLSTAAMATAIMVAAGHVLDGQISPGTRIRILIQSPARQTLVGRVDSIWKDSVSLRIDDKQNVIIPVQAISRLDQSVGRYSQGKKGRNIGIVAGGLTGLVVGIATTHESCDSVFLSGICDMGNVMEPLAYATIGALGGGVLGWLIGSQYHADIWQPQPVRRLEIAPITSGRIGIRLSMRF